MKTLMICINYYYLKRTKNYINQTEEYLMMHFLLIGLK